MKRTKFKKIIACGTISWKLPPLEGDFGVALPIQTRQNGKKFPKIRKFSKNSFWRKKSRKNVLL